MLSRAAALVLVGVAFEIVGLATPVYQITDLGSLGGSVTVGSAINNLGQITGYSFTASGAQRGFIYTPGAGMTDLGTLGGKQSAGRSINNLGQVTGFSQLADNVTARAFVYTPGSGLTDLGTLGGSYTDGFGINDRGEVTGQSTLAGFGRSEVFLHTPETGIKNLGTLGGTGNSGQAINNQGQVTGSSFLAGNTTPHVFLYTPGLGMMDLGVVGIGLGINSAGQVTGQSFETHEAFLYTPGHGLMILPGGTDSGSSINAASDVVGSSSKNPLAAHVDSCAATAMPGTSRQAIFVALGNLVKSALVTCACIGVMSRKAIRAMVSWPRHPQASTLGEFNSVTTHVRNRERKNRLGKNGIRGWIESRTIRLLLGCSLGRV